MVMMTFAVFGAFRKVAPIKFDKNGLVTPYFDGTNLTEVLNGSRFSPTVVVMAKCEGESLGIYYNDLTNDGKYLSASVYTKDCEGPIEFSVYVREE